MLKQSYTNIIISGNDYRVQANVDQDLLNESVTLLNHRISTHQQLHDSAELRATVLAALETTFDLAVCKKELIAVVKELEELKDHTSLISLRPLEEI